MPYCPDCGVEIGGAPSCPLCGARNPRSVVDVEAGCDGADKEAGETKRGNFLGEAKILENFTQKERNTIAWEVISVASVVAIMVLSSINFLTERRLSWALFPVSALVFLWIIATVVLVLEQTSPFHWILATLDLPAFLIALGLLTGDTSWAWRLALPIAIFSELVFAALLLQIRNAKRKGLNILAYILVGVALDCLGIEIFIDLYVSGAIRMSWSAITALALVPIAGFLIYFHYRVATTTNLRRLFKL
ncbi:MAG: DUF6320 domain-containing protein [Rectinemataceae bacterium]